MADTAETAPLASVVITFTLGELYWLTVRQFLRFPVVLGFLVPILFILYTELRSGSSPLWACGLALFLFAVLPAVQVFRIRNSPGVKTPTRHEFTRIGISTFMGPVNNFGHWSYVKEASEGRNYLTIKFQRGAVILPKRQLTQDQAETIRSIVRAHLGRAAKLQS